MPAELKVVWDGDVPGLTEHRLSIAAFGEALPFLLTALRRIATQMVTTAIEGEKAEVGRFTKSARQIDIEIKNVIKGSGGFEGVLEFRVDPAQTLPLFSSLAERAAIELISSIEQESNGNLSNAAVRRYLGKLPPGLNRQEYVLHDNGRVIKELKIGPLKIADFPPELPFLKKVEGTIVGVGFEPGRPEVRVKEDRDTPVMLPNSEIVERALEIRHEKVRTIAVHLPGKPTRLVSIKRASDAKFEFTYDSVEEHIFKKWNGLLGRLAK
jgi:hypothetical protein